MRLATGIAAGLTALLLATVAVVAQPPSALAQDAPFCRPGESPAFQFGFAALKAELGPIMGEPTECAHPNSANGDVLQHTTTGLSFWRKATNTPTFTDGYRHWGLTPGGMVFWTGDSIDPPAAAAARPAPAAAPAPAPGRARVSPADYFPSDREMPPRFARVGADQVRVLSGVEFVARAYGRPDGSAFLLFSTRAESPAMTGVACSGLVRGLTAEGFEVVSESQRGEGGVVMIGRVQGQPATAVLFRYGVFCGGAMMAGPIIASGTSDPNAVEQLGHVLTIMESRARAYPDGFR